MFLDFLILPKSTRQLSKIVELWKRVNEVVFTKSDGISEEQVLELMEVEILLKAIIEDDPKTEHFSKIDYWIYFITMILWQKSQHQFSEKQS